MWRRRLLLSTLFAAIASTAMGQEVMSPDPLGIESEELIAVRSPHLSCAAQPAPGFDATVALGQEPTADGPKVSDRHDLNAPDLDPDDCPGAQQRSHTGFAALVRTTGADFAAFPRRRSTWVILGIGAGAAAIAHPFDDDVNSHLASASAVGWFWAPGKVLGATYTQVAVGTGLYLVGRYALPRAEGDPKTNPMSHLGFDLVRAQIVSQAIVHGMKYAVRRDRPTGECCSFPSGHAATAFAMASVLERHLGYRAAWPTLLAATYVGTSRLHDNRHFLSDVIFGSSVGIATGWTVVGRHGRSDFALVPVPVRGGAEITLTRSY